MHKVGLLILGMVLWGGKAAADMDYRCLHTCVNNGMSSQRCMAECTYGLPLKGAAGRPGELHLSTPNPLKAPLPAGNMIYFSPHRAAPQVSRDYGCLSRCRQNGYQYQLCNEHCDNIPAAAGTAGSSAGLNPSRLINANPNAGFLDAPPTGK